MVCRRPPVLAINDLRLKSPAAQLDALRVALGPDVRFVNFVTVEEQVHAIFGARNFDLVAALADGRRQLAVALFKLDGHLPAIDFRFVLHLR